METQNEGFTLIEILIVITIIGVLALIVFVTLNPLGRFADSRNSNRIQDVETVGKSAALQFNIDNSGAWPAGVPTLLNTSSDTNGFKNSNGTPDCNYGGVVAGDSSTNAANGCMWVDDPTLASQLSPKYLTKMPTDSGTYSHLFIALTPDGAHVVVMSDSMERGVTINATGNPLYYKVF